MALVLKRRCPEYPSFLFPNNFAPHSFGRIERKGKEKLSKSEELSFPFSPQVLGNSRLFLFFHSTRLCLEKRNSHCCEGFGMKGCKGFR